MEPLTDLFAILLVLSALFAGLTWLCDGIEALQTLALTKGRRTGARRARKAAPKTRPRRRPEQEGRRLRALPARL